MRGYTWVPRFIALALKKTNLVSRNFDQLNKSAINFAVNCASLASSFVFYTGLIFVSTEYMCFSNFQRIYNMKNWKKIKINMKKKMCVSFAITPIKIMPLFIVQMQPAVSDP